MIIYYLVSIFCPEIHKFIYFSHRLITFLDDIKLETLNCTNGSKAEAKTVHSRFSS